MARYQTQNHTRCRRSAPGPSLLPAFQELPPLIATGPSVDAPHAAPISARQRLKGGARGAGVRCARPIRLQMGKAGALHEILGICLICFVNKAE